MKTLLVIIGLTWGPNYPDVQPTAFISTYDMGTEDACLTARQFEIDERDGDYIGPIGNLPGWFRMNGVFCRDPDSTE